MIRPSIKRTVQSSVLAVLFATGMACPTGGPSGSPGYDAGFLAGFALGDWYWDGYFDGWDTVDDDPIFYDDSDIQFIDDLSFDAGYWDGIWYAYNDGYFVDYTYAFVVGFSEGYDNAYWDDYLDFLEFDQHPEFLNGGWGDGYHDGFSEGRVFGANDFEQGLPFDWLDALLDYQSGTDLYFDEIDVGTGVFGPVFLYEYGVNPLAKSAKSPLRKNDGSIDVRSIRSIPGAKAPDLNSQPLFRPFDAEAAELLDVLPSTSLRDGIELRLTTTWLQRVNTYVDATSNAPFFKSQQTQRTRTAKQ